MEDAFLVVVIGVSLLAIVGAVIALASSGGQYDHIGRGGIEPVRAETPGEDVAELRGAARGPQRARASRAASRRSTSRRSSHAGSAKCRFRRMARLRRFDLDELATRPGTYFNPETEILIVVDDSAHPGAGARGHRRRRPSGSSSATRCRSTSAARRAARAPRGAGRPRRRARRARRRRGRRGGGRARAGPGSGRVLRAVAGRRPRSRAPPAVRCARSSCLAAASGSRASAISDATMPTTKQTATTSSDADRADLVEVLDQQLDARRGRARWRSSRRGSGSAGSAPRRARTARACRAARRRCPSRSARSRA